MKILVLFGSPKRKGNTSTVLAHYLKPYIEAGHEIEELFLRGMKITPCIACDKCQETGECAIPDDMTIVYQKIKEANVIIAASPIYFNSVSSWLKMMIDRCQVYWSKKFVLKDRKGYKDKDGIFICTTGVKHTEESLVGAIKVIDLFFKAVDAEFCETLWVDDTDSHPADEQVEKLKEIQKKAKKHLKELEKKHRS